MFNSDVLDVAIGLALVYALLSLLATTLGELISRALALRSATLVDAIRNVLANTDGQLLAAFWKHPLIQTLSLKKSTTSAVEGSDKPADIPPKSLGQGRDMPSYIPSNLFALALLDAVRGQTGKGEFTTSAEVRLAIDALKDPEVRRLLLAVIGIDNTTLEQTQKDLAKWFDVYMERVGGWYKRKTQVIVLVLGLALAALLNADSLTIANALLANPTLRASVVNIAAEYVQNPPVAGSSEITATVPVTDPQYLAGKVTQLANLQGKLASLNLPILWAPADGNVVDPREVPSDATGWFYKILGLLVTGLLVSLGAPFWFDLLNRFVNIRSTGKVPATVPDGSSGSGQAPAKVTDGSSDSGKPSSPDDASKPVIGKPPPPTVDLNNLADKAVQAVENLKASGRLMSRAQEEDTALWFMKSEVHRQGWAVSDAQLLGALLAAFERRSNNT